MRNHVLKTTNLSKTYKNVNALDNVSISLSPGKIYGLIGQNGAGKTTLMRIIVGLSFPTTGKIELFGHSDERSLKDERKRIGCIIEYPSMNTNMTAEENLKMHRIMRGIPSGEIEAELLKLVDLEYANKKKTKDFSLGMKQRLGIAIALLGNPEILILDEPINGLDPIGVVEIRNLLKKLCHEKNMTILISSHNLPELYQVATDYIVIHRGKVIKTFTTEQLDEGCKKHILIKCDNTEKLARVLEMELKTRNYKVMRDKTVKLYDYLDNKEKVAKIIFENNIIVSNFSIEGDTLEGYFISLIGGSSL